MNADEEVSLAEQRLSLRRKLAEQRALIAQHMAPPVEDPQAYPRSKTMRFLTRHSGSVVGVLADAASFFGIARLPRMLKSLVLGVRVLRSLRARH